MWFCSHLLSSLFVQKPLYLYFVSNSEAFNLEVLGSSIGRFLVNVFRDFLSLFRVGNLK